MINLIFCCLTLFNSLPIALKAFGIMAPDFVPLDANGQPYVQGVSTGEPVYTRQKPSAETGYISAAVCALALYFQFTRK